MSAYDIVLTKPGKSFKDFRALAITKTDGFTMNIIKGRLYSNRKTQTEAYEWYKTKAKANARLKQLIEGFKAKGYVEEPEKILFQFPVRESYTYDKAKWHYEGEFPKELDQAQAYVLTGLFIEWVIKNDLYSDELKKDAAKAIAKVKKGQMTGAEFYETELDGVLTSHDLSEFGDKFARYYCEIDTDIYADDFTRLLAKKIPTIYHVKDTKNNYRIIASQIDKRFRTWRKKSKL